MLPYFNGVDNDITIVFTIVPNHTHSWSYTASGATVTASCSNDGCTAADTSLTIQAPSSLTYDGTAKAATFSATSFCGSTTLPTISYQKKNGDTYEAATTDAPVNAGTYKASFTEGNATASVEFTISKTATTVTAVPTASAITYGSALSASILTGGQASVEGTFAWTDGTITPNVTNSGYSVTFTPTDKYIANYNTVTFTVSLTVNKADYADVIKTASADLKAKTGATVEVTLPALPSGASYGAVTNENTGYFTVGAITGGKVTVTSAKDWASTDTAKTFTVAVSGDSNHNGYNIVVTINPVFHVHTWDTAWSRDENSHWHQCTAADCDITDYSALTGADAASAAYGPHEYGADVAAVSYYTCSVCGYEDGIRKKESIAAAAAGGGDGDEDGGGYPSTGDNMPLNLLFALLTLSGVSMLVIKRRNL